jgi:hypothetical protein
VLQRIWHYVRSSEFTNFVMALATAAIAVFTYLTYEVVNSSSQDTQRLIAAAETQARSAHEISSAANDFTDSARWMEEHMKDAADAMQDSADTASNNTETIIKNTQETFRNEQRAWVGVIDATTVDFSEKEPWNLKLTFFNSGKSPAKKVQFSVAYEFSDVPLSGPSPQAIQILSYRPGHSIAPQGHFTEAIGHPTLGQPPQGGEALGFQTLISKFQDIKAKKITLYYFGKVKYEDISGHPRETQYCLFLADPDTKQPAFCDGFNDLN